MTAPHRMFIYRNKLAVALDAKGRVLAANNEPADGVHSFPFVFTYFEGEEGLDHMRALFPNAVEMRPVKVTFEIELTEAEQREENECEQGPASDWGLR